MKTDEEKADMFKMYQEGHTYQSIGNKYGCSRECVRQILDSLGNVPRSPSELFQQKLSNHGKDMVRRYLSGEGIVKLSKEYSIWQGNLRNWLRSQRVQIRGPGKHERNRGKK